MTITCGIQPTKVVTMVMKVLHNNICTLDLTDLYTWACGLCARACSHITCAHVTTITCSSVYYSLVFIN